MYCATVPGSNHSKFLLPRLSVHADLLLKPLGYSRNLLYFFQAVSMGMKFLRLANGFGHEFMELRDGPAVYLGGWRLFDDMMSWTMRPGSIGHWTF